MAGNSNLHMSRSGKEDEFYTQLSLVEDELKHYKAFFRDKVVFCQSRFSRFKRQGAILSVTTPQENAIYSALLEENRPYVVYGRFFFFLI